jgi:hypothetical protein
MSNDRKKPLWPWIVALLIGLPVLYAASFGPACWLTGRCKSLHPIFQKTYFPLGRVSHGWTPFLEGLCWFGSVGLPETGSLSWVIERDMTGDTAVILVR